MSSNHFKQDLFTQFARVGKAMSNGNRLELLEFIAQGERSIDELANVQQLVNTFLTVKDDLEPISVTELLDRARSGLVTVLDVRPSEEYQSGHVPGAIHSD
jgi:DNA-binding transcriptional ArsR family regulator